MPKSLKVVELFAGVGGFRLGLEGWNGMSPLSGYTEPLSCEGVVYRTWSNQWEPSTKRQHASEAAKRWPAGSHSNEDIAQVPTDDIPDHDLLVVASLVDYSVATTLKNWGLFGKKECCGGK